MSMHAVEVYLLAQRITFAESDMIVELVDGRTISVPPAHSAVGPLDGRLKRGIPLDVAA